MRRLSTIAGLFLLIFYVFSKGAVDAMQLELLSKEKLSGQKTVCIYIDPVDPRSLSELVRQWGGTRPQSGRNIDAESFIKEKYFNVKFNQLVSGFIEVNEKRVGNWIDKDWVGSPTIYHQFEKGTHKITLGVLDKSAVIVESFSLGDTTAGSSVEMRKTRCD